MATNQPIGGVDEARALGLKLKKVRTCSDPENPANGKACRHFDYCPHACKGQPGSVRWLDKDGKPTSWDEEGAVRHGPGPIAVGARKYKPRFGTDDFIVVDTTFDCYDFFQEAKQAEVNGGYAEVIAIEGETIMVAGSIRKTIPAADGGRPQVIEEDQLLPLKIKPFTRPMQRKELRNRAINAQKVADGSVDRRRARIEKFRQQHAQGGAPDGAGSGDSGKRDGGRGATRG